ncbi:MFS transporter [Aeromicrobium chenweiae]|uniref:MFS transporter n=1 Tax=Aeromicrobium chenweiae TaxID=2079793 RepID=A0A2S0WNS7_9ACTN|nr:MFS transporter [Aeromicrobium chenweiae]AWB92967.1 MFS transporter [Aeromicrobium chenweiae]TGN33960.1 MFS transporter [Aeromicrobium chenweiae]
MVAPTTKEQHARDRTAPARKNGRPTGTVGVRRDRGDPRRAPVSAPAPAGERLWLGPHGRVVAGIFSLAFLVAFESLAVATVMPVVAEELDGLALYALSFAAPMAVGVVSMTLAGPLMDRHGPALAVRGGVMVFSLGLFVAGLAPSMAVFLTGRAVQGLGSGFISVGLYVMIGRTFHEDMRARVFTVMTSAWVLPALAGPFIAGTIADLVGWRWVFLAVPAVAVASLGLIWQALDRIVGDRAVVLDRRRVWWAVLVAAGVLSVSLAGQRAATWWPALLLAALAVTVRYAPRLVPPGSWRGRPGLPRVVATRSLLSAGFVGAETYVPLSLVQHRGLTAAQAGLLLTTGAVLWFAGSWLAANVPVLAAKPLRVRLGSTCVLIGTAAGFLALLDQVPLWVVAAVWAVGGFGMGMALSTLGVLLLDHSGAAEQGANSAGMQISDAVAESLLLALGSVLFAVMLHVDEMVGYVLVLGFASAVAALGVVMAMRVEAARR